MFSKEEKLQTILRAFQFLLQLGYQTIPNSQVFNMRSTDNPISTSTYPTIQPTDPLSHIKWSHYLDNTFQITYIPHPDDSPDPIDIVILINGIEVAGIACLGISSKFPKHLAKITQLCTKGEMKSTIQLLLLCNLVEVSYILGIHSKSKWNQFEIAHSNPKIDQLVQTPLTQHIKVGLYECMVEYCQLMGVPPIFWKISSTTIQDIALYELCRPYSLFYTLKNYYFGKPS
ncbi:MAG: hypothetical protein QM520_01405 [Gammaproteobacteria bacterium]|nr:hypothetical protein [Gammaproteobacteria bacterium]